MFQHSVKVPRLYKIAAKVAKDVKEGVGSIKQLVYENRSKHPNIKAIYALVSVLYQRQNEIENILKRSQLLIKEPRSDPWLTKILIVELLWGKKHLHGNSKPEKTVLAYEQILKAHISDIPTSITSTKSDLDNKEDFKPRYVRVNTLRINTNEAIDGFRDEGWILSKFLDKTDYKGFLDKIASLTDEEFLVDIHIPDLLVFPAKTQFYSHPAYKNGSIILQDKASCLPVHILSPPPGSVVLDMCSAPGMKTTQVAAAINNEGRVHAVERDPKRFETLNRIVEASGATCVETINKDVLTCTAKDFPGVQYILVDPSCSGSGMTGRPGFEQSKSNERIEKLAGFQIKILRSALTRYPDAKRVVYSTCSEFSDENEDVVRQVLETNSNFKLVPAVKFVNESWKNFGSSEYGELGSYCLYAKKNEDYTNGFFVAVFERLEEGEVNQFFNTKIYNFKKHVQNQQNRKRRQLDQIINDPDQETNDYFGNNDQVYSKSEDNFVEENSKVAKKNKIKNVNNSNKSENVSDYVSDISMKTKSEELERESSKGDNMKNKGKKESTFIKIDHSEECFENENNVDIKKVKRELGVPSFNEDFFGSIKGKKKKKIRDKPILDVLEVVAENSVTDSFVPKSERKKKNKKVYTKIETPQECFANDNVAIKKEEKLENESHPVAFPETVKVKKKRKDKNPSEIISGVMEESVTDPVVSKKEHKRKRKPKHDNARDFLILDSDIVKKKKSNFPLVTGDDVDVADRGIDEIVKSKKKKKPTKE